MQLIFFLMLSSMARCDNSTTVSEDRIDLILSQMTQMGRNIGALTDSVRKIEHAEEMTSQNVHRIEKQIAEIAGEESKMEKQVGDVKAQLGEMKTETESTFFTTILSGWRYIGRGEYGTISDRIDQYLSSLSDCVTFCNKKQREEGSAWNGMVWGISDNYCSCYKNDSGHDAEYPHYMSRDYMGLRAQQVIPPRGSSRFLSRHRKPLKVPELLREDSGATGNPP